MTIETKYNVGDKVWTMRGDKPTECEIDEIEIHVFQNQYLVETLGISYRISPFKSIIRESSLFQTKELLLQSL